jgi:hypothetical protein
VEPFLPAAMHSEESVSPDGRFVLVTTLGRPFSYVVPWGRFPFVATVRDLAGAAVKAVNEAPLIEVMPKGFSSVRKGRREMEWRADAPAQLCYAEALDGGDQADFRDEVFLGTPIRHLVLFKTPASRASPRRPSRSFRLLPTPAT